MDHSITIHLIRHAPTVSNLQRRYIGWTDEPLADVEALVPIDPTLTEVFGSDLLRCKQTAKGYFPHAIYVENKALREMHFGDFECKSYEELKDIAAYRRWIDHPFTTQPPNGESFQAFQTRVMEGYRTTFKGQDQVFVVHGGVIRVLLMHLAPDEKDFWDWSVPHGVVFSLTWQNIDQIKEGLRCTSLSVEPITASESL